nr:bifunctional diguanylate cyclase/phosphodiesterase [uncultured Roseateles sp.]
MEVSADLASLNYAARCAKLSAPDQAMALAKRALQMAEAQGDALAAAEAATTLALLRSRREGQDRVEPEFARLLAEFTRLGDELGRLRIECRLAGIPLLRGDERDSWDHLIELTEALEQGGDAIDRCDALNLRALFHDRLGHTELALRTYFQLLEEAQQCPDPGSLPHALANLGYVQYAAGDSASALRQLELAGHLVENQGQASLGSLLVAHLAQCLLHLGRPQQALDALLPWLSGAKRAHENLSLLSMHTTAAHCLVMLDRLDEADELIAVALPMVGSGLREEVRAHLVHGLVEQGLGRLDGARQALAQAEGLLGRMQQLDLHLPIQLHLAQARLHEQMGDFGRAYHYLERHRQAYEQTQSSAARARVMSSQIEADLERTERARLQLEQERNEARLIGAYVDTLTGLPNRERLRIEGEELRNQHEGLLPAVLMLNINRFKAINDALGNELGDAVLLATAQRLAELPHQFLGRTHADQFCLLCTEPGRLPALQVQLEAAFATPLSVYDQWVDVSLSIGVALPPHGGETMTALMRNAETAMYADRKRLAGWTVYVPELETVRPADLTLLSELKRAVEQDELLLYLQPKVCLHDGSVHSAEALVRWQHPERGMVPPFQFIPFAEQTGRISMLTHWVLRAAMRHTVDWRQQGLQIQVSVNVSTFDLRDQGFAQRVFQLLRETGARAEDVRLEVTESAAMDDPSTTLKVMQALVDGGLSLSIDDFGTGYSSLAYLQKMPVTELKIDRAFVSGVRAGTDGEALLRATIGLAHVMGMPVVAEGAETAEEWALLQALGCDYAQGYLIARPMPVPQFLAWRERHMPFVPLIARHDEFRPTVW